ncbi:unnamed protein product [Choristocarpus tenellus]
MRANNVSVMALLVCSLQVCLAYRFPFGAPVSKRSRSSIEWSRAPSKGHDVHSQNLLPQICVERLSRREVSAYCWRGWKSYFVEAIHYGHAIRSTKMWASSSISELGSSLVTSPQDRMDDQVSALNKIEPEPEEGVVCDPNTPVGSNSVDDGLGVHLIGTSTDPEIDQTCNEDNEMDVPTWVIPTDGAPIRHRADKEGNVWWIKVLKSGEVSRKKLMPCKKLSANGETWYKILCGDKKVQVVGAQIILGSFIGVYPGDDKDLWRIEYINGDKKDNRLCNLRYVTVEDMTNQTWKEHPELPEIEVSREGAVRFSNPLRQDRPELWDWGVVGQNCKFITWREESTGLRRRLAVHHLVYRTWGSGAEHKQSQNTFVRHIDNNWLNNHIDNLDAVEVQEAWDLSEEEILSLETMSGAPGVCWSKELKKWMAFVHIGGKREYLDSFTNFEKAETTAKLAQGLADNRHAVVEERSHELGSKPDSPQDQEPKNSKSSSGLASGVKGVYWHKSDKKWVARLTLNRKRTVVGSFDVLEDATEAMTLAKRVSEFEG